MEAEKLDAAEEVRSQQELAIGMPPMFSYL